jgi:hypothetical protein
LVDDRLCPGGPLRPLRRRPRRTGALRESAGRDALAQGQRGAHQGDGRQTAHHHRADGGGLQARAGPGEGRRVHRPRCRVRGPGARLRPPHLRLVNSTIQ